MLWPIDAFPDTLAPASADMDSYIDFFILDSLNVNNYKRFKLDIS